VVCRSSAAYPEEADALGRRRADSQSVANEASFWRECLDAIKTKRAQIWSNLDAFSDAIFGVHYVRVGPCFNYRP